MKKFFFCTCFLLTLLSLQAYEKHFSLADDVWESLKVYFLPEDHPIKSKLDRLFSDPAVLTNKKSLKKRGFKQMMFRKSEMIVTSHPQLKEYKLKLFLHSSSVPDWWFYRQRLQGAALIQASIKKHHFEHLLKVPTKFLYPLPLSALPADEPNPTHFILVVEDVHPYTRRSNQEYYQFGVTKERVQALYTVIQENLLIDSIHIVNIPMCLDQKIAFIDTEHFQNLEKPIPWVRLLQSLNKKKRAFLQHLIDSNYVQ